MASAELASPSSKANPSPFRLFVVLVGILASLAGLTVLAAGVPNNLWGYSTACVAGGLVAVLFFSAWEWAFHRYLYHRILHPILKPIFLAHHRDHHYRFYPPWRFTDEVIGDEFHQAHPSVWLRVVQRFTSSRLSIPDRWVYLIVGLAVMAGPGWVLTGNLLFCAVIATAGVTLFQLFGRVHGTIHRPGTHPFVEAQPWFQFLNRHHYIHHVDPESNENFLVPLADWLLGTLRVSLTEEEEAKIKAFELRHEHH